MLCLKMSGESRRVLHSEGTFRESCLTYLAALYTRFHVDKLSSPHIYLRLPASHPDWEQIPQPLIDEWVPLLDSTAGAWCMLTF